MRGFFYAWIGSRFVTHPEVVDVDVSDLTKSTIVSIQHTLYPVLSLLVGLGAPAAVASLWGDYMVRAAVRPGAVLAPDRATLRRAASSMPVRLVPSSSCSVSTRPRR